MWQSACKDFASEGEKPCFTNSCITYYISHFAVVVKHPYISVAYNNKHVFLTMGCGSANEPTHSRTQPKGAPPIQDMHSPDKG